MISPSHDIDALTLFCRKCGGNGAILADRGTPCAQGDNVRGISHRIFARYYAGAPRAAPRASPDKRDGPWQPPDYA